MVNRRQIFGAVFGMCLVTATAAIASPDNANTTALKQFYAQGEQFTYGLNGKSVGKFRESVIAWRDRVCAWMDGNLSPGASSRFRDISEYLDHYPQRGGLKAQANWEVNYAAFLRRNLLHMIETDTWRQ